MFLTTMLRTRPGTLLCL